MAALIESLLFLVISIWLSARIQRNERWRREDDEPDLHVLLYPKGAVETWQPPLPFPEEGTPL